MPEQAQARVRFADIERAEINMQTGEFPMVLASDGEASDGDILSIEGAVFGERAPLQVSHINDPRATAGSVTGFRRDLTSSPKKLRAKGRIELGGEGPAADIRRDLAYMIQQGHVTGISVRWEPIEYTRRINLPSDHHAYVNAESEKDWRKRYGYFHKKWRVQEGSIVAVQADKECLVGRAAETQGAVSAFWTEMAKHVEPREAIELAGLPSEPPAEDAGGADARVTAPPSPDSLKAAFAAQVRELAAAGFTADDLSTIVAEQSAPAPPSAAQLASALEAATREIEAMRAELAEIKDRGTGEPVPPLRSVAAIVVHLESMLEARNRRALAAAQALIEKKLGRVSPEIQGFRDAAHAEVQKLLEDERARGNKDLSELVATLEGAGSASERAVAIDGVLGRMESMIEAARKKLAAQE